jgi:Mobilization protein NikA
MKERKQAPRDRNRAMRIYVNGDERSVINAKAKAAGLTISAYVRSAAMNRRILSIVDQEALRILSKVHGDQGRLGGLLRMYLKDPDAVGSIARALLDQIKSVQRDLAEAARKVK